MTTQTSTQPLYMIKCSTASETWYAVAEGRDEVVETTRRIRRNNCGDVHFRVARVEDAEARWFA